MDTKKSFVCIQDCYQNGVLYHKGAVKIADQCPPHFAPQNAPQVEEKVPAGNVPAGKVGAAQVKTGQAVK